MADEEINSNQPRKKRPFGLCAGEFVVPNDLDEPLPESIVDLFEKADEN